MTFFVHIAVTTGFKLFFHRVYEKVHELVAHST
jgi:hypothetical protein